MWLATSGRLVREELFSSLRRLSTPKPASAKFSSELLDRGCLQTIALDYSVLAEHGYTHNQHKWNSSLSSSMRRAARSTLTDHRFPAFYACYLLKNVRTPTATAYVPSSRVFR